jgi:hypothetical protein
MDDFIPLMSTVLGRRLAILLLHAAITRPRRPEPAARRRVDPCLGPVTGLPPRPLPTAEDVLQARLRGGAMSREDYRSAMARLATEDDASHPTPPP